VMTTYFRFARF